jgi:hypothetical protein
VDTVLSRILFDIFKVILCLENSEFIYIKKMSQNVFLSLQTDIQHMKGFAMGFIEQARSPSILDVRCDFKI